MRSREKAGTDYITISLVLLFWILALLESWLRSRDL